MPLLDPAKLEAITETGLSHFTAADLLLVDKDAKTLLSYLVVKLEQSMVAHKEDKHTSETVLNKILEIIKSSPLPFNPYIFDRVKNPQINIPIRSRKVGDDYIALTTAEGFVSALDFANIKARSEVGHYHDLNPSSKFAQILLEKPVKVYEPYFNRIYTTLIRELTNIASKDKRLEIIGSFTSLLVGLDVLAILAGKHDVYHGHVQAYPEPEKKSSKGENLNGFLPWHFLPLRILFTIQLLVNLQTREISDYSLKEFVSKLGVKDVPAARVYIIENLLKELKRNLQTYWISRSGYYIGPMAIVIYNPVISSMAKGIIESIKDKEENDSLIMYLAWNQEGRGKTRVGAHAIYLQVLKEKDATWTLLIHNLGDESQRHHPEPGKYKEAGAPVYPYVLARVTKEAWQPGEAGSQYIESILRALYPLKVKSAAFQVYYDIEHRDKQNNKLVSKKLTGPYVQFPPQDTYKDKALPAQRADNCVYENNTATRKIHFPELYDWLLEKESELSGIFEHKSIPDFKADVLEILNTSPSDELPTAEVSVDAKAEFIAHPIEAFKTAYQTGYNTIGSASSIWKSTQMKMEDYYVKLNLAQTTGTEEGGDTNILRSIDADELLAHGGHQWIVGQFGSGKSTFLQNIAWRWATQAEDKDFSWDYDFVILFPLKELQNVKISGNTLEQKIMSCLGPIYFDYRYDASLRDAFATKIFAPGTKVLWLLDGWNEVDAALGERFKEIINFIRGQEHVFISTRPLALEREDAAKPHIVVKGLSTDKISAWIDVHINDVTLVDRENREDCFAKKEALLARLKSNARVWELVHYPIILKIICMIIVDEELEVDLTSLAEIYNVMFAMFAKEHCKVDSEKIREAWQKLEDVLSVFARRIVDTDNRLVTVEEMLEATIPLMIENYQRNWANEIMQCGLLTPARSASDPKQLIPAYFMHDSFYEYLAAKNVIAELKDTPAKFVEWFKANKFEPRLQVVWRFVSGLLTTPELANAWFLLWFNYPLHMNMNNIASSHIDDIAELIMESPVRSKLSLRHDLMKFVQVNWGTDITKMPRAVAKLLRATELWLHPDAKIWLGQLSNAINMWNQSLPQPGKKTPLTATAENQFYETMQNVARLLEDIHSLDPTLVSFLDEYIGTTDLELRKFSDVKVIEKKLKKIEEHYLSHRLHYLAVIIKIRMHYEDESTIDQLIDALLWDAHNSRGKEILRLALRAIADTKLGNSRINDCLFDFLKIFKRAKPIAETLKLLVHTLSEQVSKDNSILAKLSVFLTNSEELMVAESILAALAKYRYADTAYIDRLFGILTKVAANSEMAIAITKALKECASYAPIFAADINDRLSKFPIELNLKPALKDIMPVDTHPITDPSILFNTIKKQFSTLKELSRLLSMKSDARRESGERRPEIKLRELYNDLSSHFNQNVMALCHTLENTQPMFKELLTMLASPELYAGNATVLLKKGYAILFKELSLYKTIPKDVFKCSLEYIDFKAEDRCVLYFKGSEKFEFKTKEEVAFWKGLCSLIDRALTETFAVTDMVALLSKNALLVEETSSPKVGEKRKIARLAGLFNPSLISKKPRLDSPNDSEAEETLAPSVQKVSVADNEYRVNCRYEYEDQDMCAILDLRLAEYNGVCNDIPFDTITAADTITPGSLRDRLNTEKLYHHGKRISLIPCNIGNWHWVGLLFEFDDTNNCIRAEFINSTSSKTPSTLQQQLEEVYPGVKFTERFDLIRQDDGTSCGACTIENLILSMTGTAASHTTMAKIRARHLNLLKQDSEAPAITEANKQFRINRYTSFNDRQLHNKRSFDSKRFTAFKSAEYKSASEVLGISSIAALITSLEKDLRNEICQALARVPLIMERALDGIRAVLWEHAENPTIRDISIRLLGVAKSASINTMEEFDEHSRLLINYDYLIDIYNLSLSNEIEAVRSDAEKSLRETVQKTKSAESSPAMVFGSIASQAATTISPSTSAVMPVANAVSNNAMALDGGI